MARWTLADYLVEAGFWFYVVSLVGCGLALIGHVVVVPALCLMGYC
jgi:hypothetical protein